MNIKKSYEIFADYHQFYLMDAEQNSCEPGDWTNDGVQKRIKADKYIVVIQPERNTKVPVEIQILDSAPEENSEDWDHIAEASLNLPSGKLQIEECCGETKDVLLLPSGSYKVRAFYGNLNTLSFDGLEGDDYYKIVMWQAPFDDIRVIKQYRDGRSFE